MVEDFLISIKGDQFYDEMTSGAVELVTSGSYYPQDGGYVIRYNELSEELGAETVTTVTVDRQRKVTVDRRGDIQSHMTFELGKKHLVYYDTEYGALTIGISTKRLACDLSESGGSLDIDYALEIDSAVASENQLKMNIRIPGPGRSGPVS